MGSIVPCLPVLLQQASVVASPPTQVAEETHPAAPPFADSVFHGSTAEPVAVAAAAAARQTAAEAAVFVDGPEPFAAAELVPKTVQS